MKLIQKSTSGIIPWLWIWLKVLKQSLYKWNLVSCTTQGEKYLPPTIVRWKWQMLTFSPFLSCMKWHIVQGFARNKACQDALLYYHKHFLPLHYPPAPSSDPFLCTVDTVYSGRHCVQFMSHYPCSSVERILELIT